MYNLFFPLFLFWLALKLLFIFSIILYTSSLDFILLNDNSIEMHLSFPCSQVYTNDCFALNAVVTELNVDDTDSQPNGKPSYYVALGSDNSWYLFTEKWIKTVYRTGFPNVALAQGDALPREIMRALLDKADIQWEGLAKSELGGLWCIEGSLETWSWSLNVPVLSSLSEDDEVICMR